MNNQLILLLNQCKKGNKKAQLQLYDNYCKAMYAIACRYLPSEEAKDAMQEGFLKAFMNLNSYTEQQLFGAWLKRIIINQCIDHLKSSTYKNNQFETLATNEVTLNIVDEDNWDFDATITKVAIKNAITQLSDKYKIIVQLYLIEGYDHTEISEILKIPVKTSRTQLHRAKNKLQKLLKKNYYEAGY